VGDVVSSRSIITVFLPHEDTLHPSTRGEQAKLGAPIIDQVELDITPPPQKLPSSLFVRIADVHPSLHDRNVRVQEPVRHVGDDLKNLIGRGILKGGFVGKLEFSRGEFGGRAGVSRRSRAESAQDAFTGLTMDLAGRREIVEKDTSYTSTFTSMRDLARVTSQYRPTTNPTKPRSDSRKSTCRPISSKQGRKRYDENPPSS
jgi:hypothetical protein